MKHLEDPIGNRYSQRCKDNKPIDSENVTSFEVDSQGKSALDACCLCGGGTLAACDDTPGWKDKNGDACEAYSGTKCRDGFMQLAEQTYCPPPPTPFDTP